MTKLFIKMHPSYISWLVDNKRYGIVGISNDLIASGNEIWDRLGEELDGIYPKEIIIEKPFLKLIGDNQRKIADDIIHVQRTFGVLLFVLSKLFPDATINHISAKSAREGVYNRQDISKDTQLSEVSVLLHDIKNKMYPPLALLCLHDCLVLKGYNERFTN